MSYYCHIDSSLNIENTNLQLYSLQKASTEWNELINEVKENGLKQVVSIKEKLTFIINCLGLSISQLIGQNSPPASNKRMDSPRNMFLTLISEMNSDETTKERLIRDFNEFTLYYNATRHFGKVKYDIIDNLTIDKLHSFKNMTIQIWDLVISKYRMDEENLIDSFSSIGDVIYFEKN